MKKSIIGFLFLCCVMQLHAPTPEQFPPWKPVSFEITDLTIITIHGKYPFRELPNLFLVYERKRVFGYEIIMRKFYSVTKKWH